ncbi:hypothetical protein MAM1_0024d02038 [Mucor ambiguus]|uniref:Uncharacterized protein n=1 Tax=Mucor ambiguus TaxID=91626 RepID=A0A0C9M6V6_9FUNG|nr:hypothetical protein MAM1_0024d02038 [Mucor ambiguus]
MTTIESQMASNMIQTNSKLNEILQHISDISTGRALLNINIDIPRNQFVMLAVTSIAAVSNAASSNVAVSSRVSQGSAPDVGSSQPQRSSTALYTYTLSRGVRDLKILWREWHTGLMVAHLLFFWKRRILLGNKRIEHFTTEDSGSLARSNLTLKKRASLTKLLCN